VHPFPYRVGGQVRSWGRRWRGVGQGPADLVSGERGVVPEREQDGVTRPGGTSRKKVVGERLVELRWGGGTRKLWEPGGGRPTASLLAAHTDWGVAEAWKEDQWSLFAFLMALKYADLAALADVRRDASKRSLFEERRAEL